MASGNSNNEKKYLRIVELFKKANPTLDKSKQYAKAQELWNSVKNDQSLYESKLKELKIKETKSKASLLAFWGNATSPPSKKKKDSEPSTSKEHVENLDDETTTEPEVIRIGKALNVKSFTIRFNIVNYCCPSSIFLL